MPKSNRGRKIPILLLLAMMAITGFSRAETVNLQVLTNPNAEYCNGLLKLALSYSATRYDFTYDVYPDSVERGIQQLDSGEVDVLWTGTSEKLEQVLLPVRIPLYRGLLGYRIFMIRDGTQHLFDGVNTLQDLSRLTFGQGTSWPDTAILEANGLRVVKTLKYNHLFHMLDGGRFDVFPRGVHEPWEELKKRPEMNLTVEDRLLLIYRMPFYFFVDGDNIKLQREIESGLEKALQDGRFEEYFFASPLIRTMLKEANIKTRKSFFLNNPLLPPKTPVDRQELWLDPREL